MQDRVGAPSADPNRRTTTASRSSCRGIVVHDPASVPPGYIMVICYQATCCIADARPVGLICEGQLTRRAERQSVGPAHGWMGKPSTRAMPSLRRRAQDHEGHQVPGHP